MNRPGIPPCPAAQRRPATALLALGLLLALSSPAQATLGEPLASVSSAQQQMRALRSKVAQRPGHQVHESMLNSGTRVREYTDASGTVFAVTWQGPIQPNLRVLLGSHFQRLVDAGQQPHRDHRRLAVRDRQLVIESAGRMRAYRGLAYLPDRVPAGFSFEETP